MKLTDSEKSTLLWAIKFARDGMPHNPEDPYANLMAHELLDECEKEVGALETDNQKYVVAK